MPDREATQISFSRRGFAPMVSSLAALFLAFSSSAEAPELKAIHPVGAARGTTNTFTFNGKFEPWPPKFWSEPPGLVFAPETNKNKVRIEIPADCKPGARLVRVYNADGASDPCFFVVGDGREIAEAEPNSRLQEAQELKEFPVTVDARLDKNDDTDCYKVSLGSGEWLDASVEAYTLMSKVDAVLRLVATNGVTLAWNHDYATFDPHLWWQAPHEQTVILQVFGFVYPANSDIRLTGGEEAFYRLHLGKNPPPAWRNSSDTNLATVPFEATGTIATAGQEDRRLFHANKDRYIAAEVDAASLGSPLDAWIKITDLAGKELARDDDWNGSRDPRLEWKAPSETNYFIVVGSTLNRANQDYHYRLSVTEARPAFRAVFSANSLTLDAGTTNQIKIDFKRLREHTNEVTARFEGLPKDISATVTNLPAKGGEVAFALVAPTNAAAFSGPIRLLLKDAVRETPAIVELTTRGENNGVPNGYSTLAMESYDHFWLTVKTQAMKELTTNSASK